MLIWILLILALVALGLWLAVKFGFVIVECDDIPDLSDDDYDWDD
jgi:hypothetical protein